MNKFIASMFVLLLQAPAVHAASYYVDSARGNDNWSGKLPDPSGTPKSNGPWQSLSRLAKQALVPGDTVDLRCGSVWSETLKLTASGTTTAPISVRPYPSPCVGSAPSIDGFVRISSAQWVRQAANVYKLQLPFNLLANSGFEQGLGRWQVWSPMGDGRIGVLAGCGPDRSACMQMTSGSGTRSSVFYGATFPILGGVSYKLKLDIKAPVGVTVRGYVRRSVDPFDVVGGVVTAVGTGSWQSVSVAFKGSAQLENARLDFEMPQGGLIAQVDNVEVVQEVDAPFSARLGTTSLVTAHHPNRGYSSSAPTSPFLRIAVDADVVPNAEGRTGSTYIPIGSDFTLPTGATLQAGTTVRLRPNAWTIEERKLVSRSGDRLLLDRPTSYPLKAGWGYYLAGASWMLDESGEWFYDAAAASVLTRTGADTAPVSPLSLGTLGVCIDAAGTQNLKIDGLALSGCKTGVLANNTKAVTLQRLQITDIGTDGVFAPGSKSLQVLGGRFERTGEHAILGQDLVLGIATDMVVSDNTIIDAGVARLNGKVVSLPVATLGAVLPGNTSSVINNSISGAGYNGIRTLGRGLVKGNQVDSACLVLDDCGGIYVFGPVQGSSIEGNIVKNIPGGMDGKPPGTTSQGQGIFLDDHANGVSVVGNTVTDAESGVLLHNSFNNTVKGNTLYGNRKHQIWLYEDSKTLDANGDIFGNSITDNMLFSTTPGAAVGQQSFIRDTSRFASFDRNRYSALTSSRVVSEAWPTGSGSFQFPNWQLATSPQGVLRNPDANGSVVNAIGYATFRILGANIQRNGSMSAGAAEWSPWNDRAPLATAQSVACNGQTCLEVTAGATLSLVAAPPFSVVSGNWYRVSFDVKSVSAEQSLSILVRRGGGGTNGYESLMGSAEMVTAKPAFQRVSFTFMAAKTVNASDPVTKDTGARLYFDRITPGNRITLANVEIVPVSAADATVQTRLLSNPNSTAIAVECPESAANASRCSQYLDFATGGRLFWPLSIAAKSSVVAYTRDTSLIDSDGDGVSDDQDKCPGSPNSPVNSKGCSLSQ